MPLTGVRSRQAVETADAACSVVGRRRRDPDGGAGQPGGDRRSGARRATRVAGCSASPTPRQRPGARDRAAARRSWRSSRQDSLERREAAQVLGLSHYLAGHLAEAIPYLEEVRAAPDGHEAGLRARHGLRADAPAGQGARVVRAHLPACPPDSAGRAPAHRPDDDPARARGSRRGRAERGAGEGPAPAGGALPARPDRALPLAPRRGHRADARGARDQPGARDGALPHRRHLLAPGRSGTTRSPRCSSRSGSTRTSAVPTSCSARRTAKTDQPAAAEDMLRRAVEYDPNNKSAHYLLAQVLQQAGRAEEAKREFEIAERLQGDIEVTRALGVGSPRLRLLRVAAARASAPTRGRSRFVDVADARGTARAVGLRRRRPQALHHRDQRRRRRLPRLRQRRLARRARAERHAARRTERARSRRPRPARRRCRTSIATTATARSRDVDRARRPATRPAGPRRVCAGDYDNDGWLDLFVTYYGQNVLYRNRGDGRSRTSPRARACRAAARAGDRAALRRLRPRRPRRPVRRQLPARSISRTAAEAGQGPELPLEGHPGELRAARAADRHQPPLPQRGRRHVRRRVADVRHRHASPAATR